MTALPASGAGSIVKDELTGRWKRNVGTDGHHEIWQWLSEVEGRDHEAMLAKHEEMKPPGTEDGATANAFQQTQAMLERLATEVAEVMTLLNRHGVKTVRVDGELKLARTNDGQILEPVQPEPLPASGTSDGTEEAVEDAPEPQGGDEPGIEPAEDVIHEAPLPHG